MTAQHLPESREACRIERVGVLRVLEGLARIHPGILVMDARRNVLWASERLGEITGIEGLAPGTDARGFLGQLARPQQILPLRSNLRRRTHVTGASVELAGSDGRSKTLDLDLTRIESDAGELLLVIASERAPQPAGGIEAEILDALPDALLVVDADGFVRRANLAAAALLECDEDRLLSRPVTTLLADGAPALETVSTALAGTSRPGRCELELGSRSGGARTLDVAIAPLSGGLRAIQLRDVTRERGEEQTLRRASDELEHCVAALAHDLRSPLVGLLGFSRLLRDDYEEALDDTGCHFLDRIEQAARTMESLIHDLLQLARIGAPGERPSLVDPREVLLQIHAEFKPRLEANGIELDLCDDLPSRVFCDRSRLYQVFSNLIGNAIEHMGPVRDARIEVRIHDSDGGHEIVVADNGRGVHPEQRERIFEIFQSIATRAGDARGTGMGLAIVKKIAEKHGGRAWVDGEPGAGARFHVTLPRR